MGWAVLRTGYLAITVLALASLALAALALASCAAGGGGSGSGKSGDAAGGACIPGKQDQCWCADGSASAQLCLADGTYGPCGCAGETTGETTGDTTGGETTGETTGGETTGGETTGETTGGETTGETTGGETTGGETTGGETTGGETTGGETTGGETTGETTRGDGCTDPIFVSPSTRLVTMGLPAEAGSFLCDANSDGQVNANDGQFNTAAGLLVTGGVDVNAYFQSAIGLEDHILILELLGYGGGDQAGFDVNLLRGAGKETQPNANCNDELGETCLWNIPSGELDQATCARKSVMPNGKVGGPLITAGPGSISFPLILAPNGWLDLTLENARVAGVLSGDVGIDAGRLCGTFQRTPFLNALDDLCSLDGSLSICALKGVLPGLLDCGGTETCTLVVSFESKPTAGLQVVP